MHQEQINRLRNGMQNFVDSIACDARSHDLAVAGFNAVYNTELFRRAGRFFHEDKTWRAIYEIRKIYYDTDPGKLLWLSVEGVPMPAQAEVRSEIDKFIQETKERLLELRLAAAEPQAATKAHELEQEKEKEKRTPRRMGEVRIYKYLEPTIRLSGDKTEVLGSITDLHHLAMLRKTTEVSILLRENANPNEVRMECDGSIKVEGITPLHDSVQNYKTTYIKEKIEQIVRILLEAGANPNASQTETDLCKKTRVENITPLYEAAAECSEEIIALMLSHGAKPNSVVTKVFPDGSEIPFSTPLHNASATGNVGAIDALARFGVDLEANITTVIDGMIVKNITPLLEAITFNKVSSVKALAAAGANLDARKIFVFTDEENVWEPPLHLSVRNGCAEMMRVLISAGANIEAKNASGKTALEVAIEQVYGVGDVDGRVSRQMAIELVQAGASIPLNGHNHVTSLFLQELRTFVKTKEEVHSMA